LPITAISRTLRCTGHRQPLSVNSGLAAAHAARDDSALFTLLNQSRRRAACRFN